MSQPFMDNLNRFLFKWKDLTSLGVPSSTVGSFLSNETLYKMSPRRFNFYMQVLESITNPNSSVLEKVVSRENLTRFQREQIDDKLNTILKYFDTRSDDEVKNDISKMDAKLGKNLVTSDLTIKQQGGEGLINELKSRILQKPADTTEQDLKEPLPKIFNSLNDEEKKKAITLYNSNPNFSPSNEKVNFSDRAIFVAITYVVRAIALFLVEWAVYSGFIKNFVNAFSLYFGMYVSIFLLLVFLTNAKKDDMIFRMLFFYINTVAEDGKGVLRALVHMVCVIMLLPIPYIVKEYREYSAPAVLSFSDKASILNGVEKFSLYTWILTSIVAIKV